MRVPLKTALMIFGFSSAAVAGTEDIVFMHELRIAFYEPAPKKMTRSMHKAVTAACAGVEVQSWLCSGEPLRFVRGVYVNGHKKQNGYVCLAESLGDLKFYPAEMIDESQCLVVCYNDSKRHFIDSADAQAAAESADE
jgi:hypothetical protein